MLDIELLNKIYMFLAFLGLLAVVLGGWYGYCAIILKSNEGKLVGWALAACIIGTIFCFGSIHFLTNGNGDEIFVGIKSNFVLLRYGITGII